MNAEDVANIRKNERAYDYADLEAQAELERKRKAKAAELKGDS